MKSIYFSYKTKKEPSIVKREPIDDLLEDIKEERITEVTELPPSNNIDISRIPSPLPFQKNANIIADLDSVNIHLVFLLQTTKQTETKSVVFSQATGIRLPPYASFAVDFFLGLPKRCC